MDVRVISLHEPTRLLRAARRVWPDADVGLQRGVDLRAVPVDALYESRFVSRTAAFTLARGRKWHHEIGSRGAVGLAHAVRLALAERPDRPLLLLEDDCVLKDAEALRADVAALRAHMDAFDVASFGASMFDKTVRNPPVAYLSEGWHALHRGEFYLLHCAFYTPHARRLLSAHLREHPLEMQLDALYSSMASLGELRVLVQTEHASAVQKRHVSSIQEGVGSCALCSTSARTITLGIPVPYLLGLCCLAGALTRHTVGTRCAATARS